MDTLGGEATIRWDLSIGVGGWGSLKLSDRLRTCGESGVKGQAGRRSLPPVWPLGAAMGQWETRVLPAHKSGCLKRGVRKQRRGPLSSQPNPAPQKDEGETHTGLTGDRDGRVEVAVAQLMLVKMWGDTGIWIEGNACGGKEGSALALGAPPFPRATPQAFTSQPGVPANWECWGWDGNPCATSPPLPDPANMGHGTRAASPFAGAQQLLHSCNCFRL